MFLKCDLRPPYVITTEALWKIKMPRSRLRSTESRVLAEEGGVGVQTCVPCLTLWDPDAQLSLRPRSPDERTLTLLRKTEQDRMVTSRGQQSPEPRLQQAAKGC